MSENAMPEVGQEAPDFEGVDQHGRTIRLCDFRGRKVALYFYPKDDTPGCTKQACSLRDGYARLQEAGVVVLGVSADDADSHRRFAEKYGLPFPLVADPEAKICRAYGVWGERTLYGRKFMGIRRTTFLIDEDGRIRQIIRRPKVDQHADEVLQGFGLA
jgi:peroxiredoxin Q/BCP